MQSCTSPTFRRNISARSSGSRSKEGELLAEIVFKFEKKCSIFLRDAGEFLPNYTALNLGREYSSQSSLWESEIHFWFRFLFKLWAATDQRVMRKN
jgi:hypothetical protein